MREYVAGTPRRQSLVDLFEGEWATRFPDEVGVRAGDAALFDDDRIPWLVERVGGVEGMRVLELGPLDGAHTAMLLEAGADEVVAVEANVRAFLRCLVTRELLDLTGARFLLGEVGAYVEGAAASWDGDGPAFDLVVASGVLYHLLEPADLLLGLGGLSDRVFLWTHHVDLDAIRSTNDTGLLDRMTTSAEKLLPDDSTVTYHQHGYELGAIQRSFCGGPADASNWMELEGIHHVLDLAGLEEREEAFDHRDHPNGPAIAMLATRTEPRPADRSRPAPRWGLSSSLDPDGPQVEPVPDAASYRRAVDREEDLVNRVAELEARVHAAEGLLARRDARAVVKRALHPWLRS